MAGAGGSSPYLLGLMKSEADWLRTAWETPDQALVWGVALGLNEEVETVLRRSVASVRIEPGGRDARIRGLQVHGTGTEGK